MATKLLPGELVAIREARIRAGQQVDSLTKILDALSGIEDDKTTNIDELRSLALDSSALIDTMTEVSDVLNQVYRTIQAEGRN